MKRGRDERSEFASRHRGPRKDSDSIAGEDSGRHDADDDDDSEKPNGQPNRPNHNDAAMTEKKRSPPSPLDSLPDMLLFRVLFSLSDDARSMGKFVASYGRLSTLAGMPCPPEDAPETVVEEWDGGCHEMRRGANDILTAEEGYSDLAPELKERARRSFSGALWQIHQLRKIRSEGPAKVVDKIEGIDFTVSPVVVPGSGTVLLGSKERELGAGSVAQWNTESCAAEVRFHLEMDRFSGSVHVSSLAVAGGNVYVGRTGGDGTIQVWNTATWAREKQRDLVGHQECEVCALLVVRSETLISAGAGEHGIPSLPEVKVWNLNTNECIHSFRNIERHWEPSVAISADLNTLVCASLQSRQMDIWDVSASYANATRTEIDLPAHFRGVDALATSDFSASAHPGGFLACSHRVTCTSSSGAFVAKPLSKYTVTLWSFSSPISLLRTFDDIAGFEMSCWPCTLLWCGKVLISGADRQIFNMKGLEKLDRCDLDESRRVAEEDLKFVPLMYKGKPLSLLPGVDAFALVGGTVIATQTNCSEIYMLE